MTFIEHSHCPAGCDDHPQPFRAFVTRAAAQFYYLDPGVELELCGRCWVIEGELTQMVPCAPATCKEARKLEKDRE